MTEETHDLIMSSGDETIIHSASQMPGPIDTCTIGNLALGRLTSRRSKIPTFTFDSKEELIQFAGHLGGLLARFSRRMAKSQNSMYLNIGCLLTQGQKQAKDFVKLQR